MIRRKFDNVNYNPAIPEKVAIELFKRTFYEKFRLMVDVVVLGGEYKLEEPKDINIIALAVSRVFDVNQILLAKNGASKKSQVVVEAKAAFVNLARQAGFSLPAIARYMKYKNHTGVLNSDKLSATFLNDSPHYREKFLRTLKKLN